MASASSEPRALGPKWFAPLSRWAAKSWMFVLFFIGFFLFWEVSIDLFQVPRYILNKPSEIIMASRANLPRLLEYTYVTGLEAVLGYVIAIAIAALGGAMQRARQRSEASEQRFRAFMQNSPNGVFLKDEGGRYLFMNRTGERLASRTDWLGKTDEELIGGRVAREIRAHDHAVLEKNAPQLYDLAFPTPDGVRTLSSRTRYSPPASRTRSMPAMCT